MEQKNKESFVVINEKGLHTRPSTELVKCAANYEAEINLTYQDLTVNAKSLLGILMLAAAKGAKIQIDASGPDAEQAITAIRTLAENKFNVKY
ncbi:MAG: HPr family phosphocarrier protein [Simkaniaceae bacterium]|nr:HPr family phosphocarrier protein [Candidatus Sacchlamyda saccharinae]